MFLIAAISPGSSSVPLLLIGSWWIAMGLGGVWEWPRVARELRLEDERITFVFPAKELTMPAADVINIRRRGWDPRHAGSLLFRTQSHGTVKVAARLRGLIDLLAELRRLNPRVTYPDF